MQIASNPMDTVMTIIVAILFAVLLIGHLSLAFWIGLRTTWQRRWWHLIGLSVLTSTLWLIAAIVISVMQLLDAPRLITSIDMYGATLGIPYDLNIPATLLSIPAIE